ncbi:MAG: LysM peptidoglycan-binding domain-containing protein [Planctomycetota bacterium]|jgi:nucleoid-associated protein YgaU
MASNASMMQRMSIGVLVLAGVWVVSYWMIDAGGAGDSTGPPITIDSTEVYVVQAGDRLETIAESLYGDTSMWETLYEANRDVLEDPANFKAGLRLIVPRVEDDE